MAKKDRQPDQAAQEQTPEQPHEQSQEKTKEEELTEQLQRLQAEFDNYRKRVEAENQRAAERGQEKLLKDILLVADSIELAIKHAKDTETIQGVQLIGNQLASILENHGVQRVPAEGPVDPRLHEVYITETNDTVQPNHVLETLQHGYTRNGAVLRTAKVKAARKERT